MAEEKKGFFKRLVSGLTKTRDNIVSGFDSIFSGFSHIDDDFYEELEEILVMGDIGIHATEEIIENLKKKVKENHIKEPADCRELLINSIKEQMYGHRRQWRWKDYYHWKIGRKIEKPREKSDSWSGGYFSCRCG